MAVVMQGNTPPNQLLPTVTRYSKRDICYLLFDPNVNLNNPGNARRIKYSTLKKWIVKKNLFTDLGVTEKEYDAMRTLSYSQSLVIMKAFS